MQRLSLIFVPLLACRHHYSLKRRSNQNAVFSLARQLVSRRGHMASSCSIAALTVSKAAPTVGGVYATIYHDTSDN